MRRSHDQPIYGSCDICREQKRCGPHLYEGRGVPAWGMWVCDICRLTNDVPPAYEAQTVARLNAKGISFSRNAKGFIIIPQ